MTSLLIKDRIKELRRFKGSDLAAHPKNWRKHPATQKQAMESVLASVGWADAVLARETPDGLELIDGHLRSDMSPDDEIPVLILDVDEHEAEMILATHDPLAAMANANTDDLQALLDDFDDDEVVQLYSLKSTSLCSILLLVVSLRVSDPFRKFKFGEIN